MNIFSKFYCRVYQIVMRVFMPMLPYREPKLLNNEEEIISVLKEEEITNVMLVTGKVVRSNGSTSSLENKLNQNFSLTVLTMQ